MLTMKQHQHRRNRLSSTSPLEDRILTVSRPTQTLSSLGLGILSRTPRTDMLNVRCPASREALTLESPSAVSSLTKLKSSLTISMNRPTHRRSCLEMRTRDHPRIHSHINNMPWRSQIKDRMMLDRLSLKALIQPLTSLQHFDRLSSWRGSNMRGQIVIRRLNLIVHSPWGETQEK